MSPWYKSCQHWYTKFLWYNMKWSSKTSWLVIKQFCKSFQFVRLSSPHHPAIHTVNNILIIFIHAICNHLYLINDAMSISFPLLLFAWLIYWIPFPRFICQITISIYWHLLQSFLQFSNFSVTNKWNNSTNNQWTHH